MTFLRHRSTRRVALATVALGALVTIGARPHLGEPAPARYKYVALGDSFSAGEGIEPFFETANRCHRSKRAYPTLVERPGQPGTPIRQLASDRSSGVQWGFQACSGAVAADLVSSGQWGDPLPQLALDRASDIRNAHDLPVDGDTDLVTVTIGGNDVHFSDVLRFCAMSNDCTTEPYDGRSLEQYARKQRHRLADELDKVYRQLHEQAPDARILVLGYPQLFPASDKEQSCRKLAQKRYFARQDGHLVHRSIGFSHREQNYLREAAAELNRTIAARAEASPAATFVPVDDAFAGHEVCGRRGAWVNGPSLALWESIKRRRVKVSDRSFHPNWAGQTYGYAATVNQVLNPRS